MGEEDLILVLIHASSRLSEEAAFRLGMKKSKRAVPYLIDALGRPKSDLPRRAGGGDV